MQPALSTPAFRLLLRCCAGAAAPDRQESQAVDWTDFLHLVRRHRVQGLTWKALSRREAVPRPIARVLGADASRIAAEGLQSAAESGRLLTALRQGSVPALFIKGLTLSALAYGNPFVKMSADIDLLVDHAAVSQAAAVLDDLGYAPAVPGRREEVEGWHAHSKESVWQRAGGPTVELHSRLADNAALIPAIGMGSVQQEVPTTPALSLPTLGPDEQFAYLCVHGASSAWFRLKWLSDVAALLRPLDPARIEQLYRRSQRLGAGRAAGLALLLCHRLFSTGVPSTLLTLFEGDQATRALGQIALRQLADPREPTERLLGTLGIHASQLLLKPGWRFAWAEGRRQAGEALAARRLNRS